MKLCISAVGPDLHAAVDPRFGRAAHYLIFDTKTRAIEHIENTAALSGGGAGTKAAQTVINRGVQAVLTGNVGPNAFAALSLAGIKMYTGVSGTVQDALALFLAHELQPVAGPTVSAHAGTGNSTGRGGRA